MGVTAKRYKVSFGGDENDLELDSDKGFPQLCEYTQNIELYTLKG